MGRNNDFIIKNYNFFLIIQNTLKWKIIVVMCIKLHRM